MLKIKFLINTLTGGGAEKVLIDLVNNLPAEQYRIDVQTIVNEDNYNLYLKKHIHYSAIIHTKNKILKKILLRFVNRYIPPKVIYNMFIRQDMDIEVAFLEGAPTKLIAASTNGNSRKIAWVHTDLYQYYGHKKVFRNLEENMNCYRKFNKIVCVSQCAYDGFVKRFKSMDTLTVKYNLYPCEEISALGRESITETEITDKFTIVCVGRLCKEKGFDRLVRACKRLSDEGYEFTVWIVGEGAERENLTRMVQEYSLENRIRLLGYQKNPYKFMKNADLLVCSSLVEGFVGVVIEALLLGTAVVMTNCAAAKEMLGDSEYGKIVPNHEEGIYAGMKMFLDDPGIAARYALKNGEIHEKFSLDKRMKDIQTVFEESEQN